MSSAMLLLHTCEDLVDEFTINKIFIFRNWPIQITDAGARFGSFIIQISELLRFKGWTVRIYYA